MTEHTAANMQHDSEFTNAFERVITGLQWFWTNPTVRKYLLVSKLKREHVRTISAFLDDAEHDGGNRTLTPSRVDPLIRAALELANSIENEVKPMIDIEVRRAGPGRGDAAKTQLKLTRSALETNTHALLRDLETLRTAAANHRD
ncbi:MAG: hypothetical protein ACOCRN_02845 [Spirochaetia bacterium]